VNGVLLCIYNNEISERISGDQKYENFGSKIDYYSIYQENNDSKTVEEKVEPSLRFKYDLGYLQEIKNENLQDLLLVVFQVIKSNTEKLSEKCVFELLEFVYHLISTGNVFQTPKYKDLIEKMLTEQQKEELEIIDDNLFFDNETDVIFFDKKEVLENKEVKQKEEIKIEKEGKNEEVINLEGGDMELKDIEELSIPLKSKLFTNHLDLIESLINESKIPYLEQKKSKVVLSGKVIIEISDFIRRLYRSTNHVETKYFIIEILFSVYLRCSIDQIDDALLFIQSVLIKL
jgi:hypothetical protein